MGDVVYEVILCSLSPPLRSEWPGEAGVCPDIRSAWSGLSPPTPVLCRAVDNIWYPLLFLAFCLQLKGPCSLVSLSPSKASVRHQLGVPLVSS